MRPFAKAKTNARTELFNQLNKKAEALYVSLAKVLKQCQADQRLADGQAADCDTGLREVLSTVGQGDQAGAKTAAAKVGKAAKALGELHKRVVATHQKAQEVFRKEVKACDLPDPRISGRLPAHKSIDDADALVLAMKRIIDTLAEYASDGKQAVEETVKALKGGADAEAVYLAGAERLEKRAIQAVATLDQTFRDIGGTIDRADQDRMNGDEAREPETKERLYLAARNALQLQKERCQNIVQELNRNKQEIQRALASFPQSALGNPKLKPSLDHIRQAQGFLEEITQGIEKEVARIKKIEGKLP